MSNPAENPPKTATLSVACGVFRATRYQDRERSYQQQREHLLRTSNPPVQDRTDRPI